MTINLLNAGINQEVVTDVGLVLMDYLMSFGISGSDSEKLTKILIARVIDGYLKSGLQSAINARLTQQYLINKLYMDAKELALILDVTGELYNMTQE